MRRRGSEANPLNVPSGVASGVASPELSSHFIPFELPVRTQPIEDLPESARLRSLRPAARCHWKLLGAAAEAESRCVRLGTAAVNVSNGAPCVEVAAAAAGCGVAAAAGAPLPRPAKAAGGAFGGGGGGHARACVWLCDSGMEPT